MACELCMWTDATADAAATDWAQRYKAMRQLPMEERGQRVEAYRKEERDYLVWQRQQDGGKLPWVTSSFTVTCTHGCKIGFTQAELVRYWTSAKVELLEHGESPSKAAPFVNGRPRPRKFCRSKPQHGKFRDPNAPHCKFTQSDFKKATRPTSTARVQKYRASCSEEERKFNREDAKLKRQSYACKVCGRLNHSAKDSKRCPMQQASITK